MNEDILFASDYIGQPAYWFTAPYAWIWPAMLAAILGLLGVVSYFFYNRELGSWNVERSARPPSRWVAVATGMATPIGLCFLGWLGIAAVQPMTPDIMTLLGTLAVCLVPVTVTSCLVGWTAARFAAGRAQPDFPGSASI